MKTKTKKPICDSCESREVIKDKPIKVTEQKYGPVPGKPLDLNYDDIMKHFTNKKGEVLKYHENKSEWSCVPFTALEKVAEVFSYGKKKYGASFTFTAGIPVSRLFDSLMRHAISFYFKREDIDPESGCHHLAMVVSNALMILSYIEDKSEFDDRPNKKETSILKKKEDK